MKFIPLDANERFKELQNRKVDILSRNSTWNMSRETELRPVFRRRSPIMTARASWCRARATSNSALELDGSKVCVQAGHDDASSTSPTISAPTT